MANHEFFLKFFEEFTFPTSDEITEKADGLLQAANDILRMYRGDYRELMQAFQLFIATDCRPFAYLGAAKVLVDASYLNGSNYEKEGIIEAQNFLDKARAIIPHHLDVEIQQVVIYRLQKNHEKAKALMDALSLRADTKSYYGFAMLQMSYWEDQKNIPQIEFWHQKAMESAKTDVQRLYALNRLASCFMVLGNHPQAISLYQQVVKLDPNDPWAWHNLSYMLIRRKDYALAGQYNRNALNIMEFGNAFKILDQLVAVWHPHRHANLVEEVPRYLSQESRSEKKGLFGRLFGE